ncbi:hypothetical protein BDR07DRAFT_686644 [Suillus spraguei]|nr:hypothetical protein BDR07DRAFT_686644 [Suillus spraguei]
MEQTEGRSRYDVIYKGWWTFQLLNSDAVAHRVSVQSINMFRPTRDLNVYELSTDEASATGLQNETSVPSSDREETLALLGSCALIVLSGSISILGVTLSASKVAHHVFAPRAAPIPILRCASSDVHDDSNIYSLPPRIRNNDGGAVVAIQSLDTGVESLGRVCRVFDGVFEPSRWQRSSAEVIRPGVSLVCVLFSNVCNVSFVLSYR